MKYLLPLLLLLTACETTVKLPEPKHTPRVAVLFTLSNAPQDSSFQALYQQRQLSVSNSQSVFDTTDLTARPDATAELRDATGAVLERYRYRESSDRGYDYYAYFPTLNFQPQPGQAYTLRTALPGLEPAESTQTLPRPATIESAGYTPRATPGGGDPSSFQGRLTLTLRDDPGAANYYVAYARALGPDGQPGAWTPLAVDNGDDAPITPIGQFQLSSPLDDDALYPFADTDANGQRISLSTNVQFYNYDCYLGTCDPPGFIEVVVSSITAEAYNFYLARRRYQDSDGNPFAEPAPLPSNVHPGYGLFGAATDVKYRIAL